MKKRILSILLTLCMLFCLVPTSVFAEDNMAANGTAEVSTAAELVSAIREASYGTVKLTSDITIYTTLVVNRTVTLDLNGYMLKYGSSSAGHIITVSSGILTIENSDYTKSHNFQKKYNLYVNDFLNFAPFKIILILAFNFFHSKNRPISFYKLPIIIKSCRHIILLQTRKTNEKEIRK